MNIQRGALPQLTLISTPEKWGQAAARLSQESELALDTESNSLYAYRERICLIQIATSQETFLVDPLAVNDLSALGQLLADPSIVKVLHGSDYDLRCLDRDYGFGVKSLFDTETAARFLGETRPNLASMLETFLGVKISKSNKLQRSNWGLRPLSHQALEYASDDVRHLLRLAAEVRRRLTRLDRLEWVSEECQRWERRKYTPSNPPEVAFLRIKGTDQLRPRALAVLKELFQWREGVAERLDHPPFRVVGNETLVNLAQASISSSVSYPLEVRNIFPRVSKQLADGMRAAISLGLAGPEFHRTRLPRQDNPWTPESREQLQRFKRWRTGQGAALGLDPALLWPAASLERLVLKPDNWRSEILDDGSTEVRAWQRREFGKELMEVLKFKK